VAFEHLAEKRYGAEGDRRVEYLLERTMDDERSRFGIEDMDGQLVIALYERLLVVKPGFVEEPNLGGLVASIYYRDVTDEPSTNLPRQQSHISKGFLFYPATRAAYPKRGRLQKAQTAPLLCFGSWRNRPRKLKASLVLARTTCPMFLSAPEEE
jgi:hypothetical protein